jgi:hypothetical protein
VRSLEKREDMRWFAEAQARHEAEGGAWGERDAQHVAHLAGYAAEWPNPD